MKNYFHYKFQNANSDRIDFVPLSGLRLKKNCNCTLKLAHNLLISQIVVTILFSGNLLCNLCRCVSNL